MTDAHLQDLGLLPLLVIVAAVSLIVGGIILHGVTLETCHRIWHSMFDRPSGPLAFRFILQPLLGAILAVRDGVGDAKTGRSSYFWALATERGRRVALLREALNATARIVPIGLAMDMAYRIIVYERFYPVEALVIAFLLAFTPYVLLRGPVSRIARRLRRPAPAKGVER